MYAGWAGWAVCKKRRSAERHGVVIHTQIVSREPSDAQLVYTTADVSTSLHTGARGHKRGRHLTRRGAALVIDKLEGCAKIRMDGTGTETTMNKRGWGIVWLGTLYRGGWMSMQTFDARKRMRGEAPDGLGVVDPLAPALLALEPLGVEVGDVELVEVVGRRGGGDGGDEPGNLAAYARWKKMRGVARRRRSGEGTEAEMRGHSQTQLFGLLRLVMTSTLLADLAMGMAQQTTRGVERPLLLIVKQADGAQSVATWSWRAGETRELRDGAYWSVDVVCTRKCKPRAGFRDADVWARLATRGWT
ncbi:predicted protein [Postia placenta Mad-698-R]|nr:predicted protein [Postia placenta Mad-698-R]